MNTFIERSGTVIFIFTIVLAMIFTLLGFEIINTTLNNVLKVLYSIMLILAIISFYKSKKKNSNLLIFLPVPFIIATSLTETIFIIVTLIIIFPMFFIKGLKKGRRIIGISIYSVFIIIGAFFSMIGSFGAYTAINQQYSPNGNYRVVTIDSDQGALGGDTYVDVERIYLGIIKKDINTLYDGKWGEKPKVLWVDDTTVNINGKEMNIHTSKTWYDKN